MASSSEGVNEQHLERRAAYWYRTALPELSGLAKDKVESRLGNVSPSPQKSEEPNGDDSVQRAIGRGLAWLQQKQRGDGSWSFQTGPNPGDHPSTIAATGLALSCFTKAGHTHRHGDYRVVVERGLAYVLSNIKRDGDLRGNTPQNNMYVQGIGAVALCQMYGRSKDRRLREPSQLAINFIVRAQDPAGGGWRYQPRQPGDTSVFGWQLTAIKVAQAAGLQVPRQTLQLASKFLDSVQADQGRQYGYKEPGSGDLTTAIGLLGRLYLEARNHPGIEAGVSNLSQTGPRLECYFNLYATRLMRQYGGSSWEEWKPEIRKRLLSTQKDATEAAGSWYTTASEGLHVEQSAGRLGVTCFCLLTLMETMEQ